MQENVIDRQMDRQTSQYAPSSSLKLDLRLFLWISDSQAFSKKLTGCATWVHILKPLQRADNKQRKQKDQACPPITGRAISTKKLFQAIFFNSSRPVHLVIQSVDTCLSALCWRNLKGFTTRGPMVLSCSPEYLMYTEM